jgi:hypothetical protein
MMAAHTISKLAALMLAAAPLALASGTLSVLSVGEVAAQGQGNGGGNGNGGGGGGGGGNSGNGGGGNADRDRSGPPAHANGGGRQASAATEAGERRTGRPAHSNAGGSQQGQIARALGGANASHASAQAFANASDDSMLGRLREVHGLFGESDAARTALGEATAALEEFAATYDGRTPEEIAADITRVEEEIGTLDTQLVDGAITQEEYDTAAAPLNEELAGYLDEQTALAEFETERTALEDAVAEAEDAYSDALTAEDEALAGVTNPVHELTDEAREVLRNRLNERLGDPNAEESAGLETDGETVVTEEVALATE